MPIKPALTPVMQQYLDIKSECPGAVLLFRLGDFYECFFEDAVVVSRALELVLTRRGTDASGGEIPMCGIPWHAAENYLGRLVRAGYNVAIAEQLESPEEAKARGAKQIKRGVVRVLTAGTLTDENLLSPKKSNFLVAIVPENSLFHIAGCDISTGEFFVGELSDGLFDEMVRINPSEIIYPESAAELPDIKRIRTAFRTTPLYDRIFERENISDTVRTIFGIDKTSVNMSVNLLAGYLEQTQRGAKLSFRAPYRLGAGARLLVDAATWRSLEIDEPMQSGGATLLDILDKTKTAAGARKLRAYLRELSGDISEIRSRQEHIGHLLLNSHVAAELGALLSKTSDIGRALGRLLSGRGCPRDLKGCAEFIARLPEFKICGRKLDSNQSACFENINTMDGLSAELRLALSDECPAFFRDGGIIRGGYDTALDNMNSLAHGAKEVIASLQSEYAAASGINTLKIKYNNILGYHIEVPAAKAGALFDAKDTYIHRQTMAGNVRFTTARLIELDNEVRGAAEKAAAIEAEIIAKLIEHIRAAADDLMYVADLLADADVWLSLSLAAEEYSWTRPNMTDGGEFAVTGGRHPVVECMLRGRGDQFVKNDCDLNEKRIALLTGPNMAGKSTYLRQNALIVVLAHLGSFVPANSASIGICDQLFSRVGASDNLAAGQSTFMVEMTETANILNRATEKSFIIFDEIGRGTATFDGMAIAQAVLEFVDNAAPRTLFATHYHELTALSDTRNSITNLTVQVAEHNNEIVFLHKIMPGVAGSSYGIHVAKMSGMPASVVESAERILQQLESREHREQSIDRAPPPVVVPGTEEPSIVKKVKEPELAAKKQMSLFGE
ncbi:MAG: DNA mismatch repair protein MutS [Alphaproteobacteria bacterium]|nr:DNA mismatch repair protein MutS [Alphaproteobacteria bacterium]